MAVELPLSSEQFLYLIGLVMGNSFRCGFVVEALQVLQILQIPEYCKTQIAELTESCCVTL